MRLTLASVLMLFGLVLLIHAAPVRAEGDAPITTSAREVPDGVQEDDREYIMKVEADKKKQVEHMKEGFEKLAKVTAELKNTRETKLDVLGKGEVTIDEETKGVTEPKTSEEALDLKKQLRDVYEPSPDDFNIYTHGIWSINASDFKIDPPQYITIDEVSGRTKTYFAISFQVTNTTAQRRRMAPTFTAVTSKGVFNTAISAFLPERMLANSMYRPVGGSELLADKDMLGQRIMPLESLVALGTELLDPETGATKADTSGATFEAGQTRTGVALWTNFSNEFTELKIVVGGLTNAHHYSARLVPASVDSAKPELPKVASDAECMRRVLVLTFERNGDEFDIHRKVLQYKDKRFVYAWMWDQDITVPLPTDAKDPQLKVQTIKTPAGADKLMWTFPFIVKNSTRYTQTFAINGIDYVCPMDVDAGGTKVHVDVKVHDDGNSTVYKAQLLKAAQQESPRDRFDANTAPEYEEVRSVRRKFTFEPGKGIEAPRWAAFDIDNIDWTDARVQAEAILTAGFDKKAAAKETWEKVAQAIAPDNKDLAAKNPGILYDPRRRLTDDEFAKFQEAVKAGIAGALEAAKSKKTVVAYFDCTSGLSTGAYRVSRSYRLPGVVDDAWLKAWEELDKPAADK